MERVLEDQYGQGWEKNVVESRIATGFPAYSMLVEFGMIFGWQA
jgi:hypothetical protein